MTKEIPKSIDITVTNQMFLEFRDELKLLISSELHKMRAEIGTDMMKMKTDLTTEMTSLKSDINSLK